MAHYNTGWVNNPMNDVFSQGITQGFDQFEGQVFSQGIPQGFNQGFNQGMGQGFAPSNTIEQVNNFENVNVINGQSYDVESQNYHDNYNYKVNHYFVKDTNYIKDHYIDYNVYHYDTNNINCKPSYGEENVVADGMAPWDRPTNQCQPNNKCNMHCSLTPVKDVIWNKNTNCNCNCGSNNCNLGNKGCGCGKKHNCKYDCKPVKKCNCKCCR